MNVMDEAIIDKVGVLPQICCAGFAHRTARVEQIRDLKNSRSHRWQQLDHPLDDAVIERMHRVPFAV
jgi:hypothetical protein